MSKALETRCCVALLTAALAWASTRAHAQWPGAGAQPSQPVAAGGQSEASVNVGANAQGAPAQSAASAMPADETPAPSSHAAAIEPSTGAEQGSAQPAAAPPPASGAAPQSVLGPPSATATTQVAERQTTEQGGETEAEEDKPFVPWMASLMWSNGYTVAGLSRSSTLTFNPTYAWAFLLTAGYNFDKRTSLVLNQYAVLELTDSDTTTTRQELFLYDTALDASHKFIMLEPSPEQEFVLSAGGGVLFPTSKTSRAASLILGTRARVGANYSWKRVLHGLDVGPSFSYQRRWNGSNTLAAQSPFPCLRAGGASQDCGYLGSLSTSRDVFLLGVDANLELTEKWFANVSLTFWWVLARSFDTTVENTSTGPVLLPDMSLTHSRNSRWLLFGLGYKITDWFSATARVTNIFSERGMAGQIRGVFNPIDTVIGLELAVSFDQLYLSTQPHAATGG